MINCYGGIVLYLFFFNSVYGSFLQFLPLSANQVYSALKRAGREDAVPEGRFITHGLAAMSGFAAGIASGIGVPLVLNIDLANVTGILGSSNSNTSNNKAKIQEICFNTRSLNEINDDEVDRQDNEIMEKVNNGRIKVREGRARRVNEYDDEDTMGTNTSSSDVEPEVGNVQTGTTSSDDPVDDTTRFLPSYLTTNDNVAANAEITNDVTSPVATDGQTNTNTGTTVDDGAGTGTNTETTTQTGTGGSVNCIVIQKPTKR